MPIVEKSLVVQVNEEIATSYDLLIDTETSFALELLQAIDEGFLYEGVLNLASIVVADLGLNNNIPFSALIFAASSVVVIDPWSYMQNIGVALYDVSFAIRRLSANIFGQAASHVLDQFFTIIRFNQSIEILRLQANEELGLQGWSYLSQSEDFAFVDPTLSVLIAVDQNAMQSYGNHVSQDAVTALNLTPRETSLVLIRGKVVIFTSAFLLRFALGWVLPISF